MQNKKNIVDRFSTGFVTLMLGVFGYNYFTAPDVKRPVYNSKEDCLADWANTPQDCEESTTHLNPGGRVWYGPWMDGRGTAYHANGTRSQRPSHSIHANNFSSSSRLGFGSSRGYAGG